jgi:hypothetical protein
MTENYPPHNMLDDNNKLIGIATDILEIILKNTKSKLTINDVKVLPWSRAYKVVQKKPNSLPIVLGKYQDSDCGMVVESMEFACEIVTDDGKTRFFHDVGGMANYLKDKSYKQNAVIWVYTKDTNRWIDGKTAFYSTNEKTPMSYGFGSYEEKKDGYISYDEMFLRVLRGETLQDPKLRKKALGY